MHKRRTLALSAALALTLVAAACGSDSNDTAETTVAAEVVETTAAPVETEPAATETTAAPTDTAAATETTAAAAAAARTSSPRSASSSRQEGHDLLVHP